MTDIKSLEFINRLRVLLNIDYHDLTDILHGDDEWREFRTNPWRWMITTDTARAEKVFQLMEARHNKRLHLMRDVLGVRK